MIYLDHLATTPVDPAVLAAAEPYFRHAFGNAHSAEHAMGQQAAQVVDAARAQIAALIGAEPREIVFTSGATEANNLAIKGFARFAGTDGPKRIITLATEHKCVLESLRALGEEGFEPLVLPVRPDGLLDLDLLAEALHAQPTLLVSVMAANNETGVLQDLPAIARLVHEAGATLHSDLAQAAGKIPLDVASAGLGLASLSAHKLYGPKGIGALYVRRRPRVRLMPLFSGGGQERGLRPGTLPVPLIAGFAEACRLARMSLDAEAERQLGLRRRLLAALRRDIAGLEETVQGVPVLPGAISLRFPAIRALDLIAACRDSLCLSTGSACSAAEIAPSHVLTAMGLSAEAAGRTLRVGIGRFTSAADIDRAAGLLADAHRALRQRGQTQTAAPNPAPNLAEVD